MIALFLSNVFIAEERDEYDKEFERMRQENLQSRKQAIEEELEAAGRQVAECRAVLQKARDQVTHWREKVDRACIERLKSFQNPPPIVLQVTEMVMALLGRHFPLGQTPAERTEKVPNEDASTLSGRHSAISSPGPKSPVKPHRSQSKNPTFLLSTLPPHSSVVVLGHTRSSHMLYWYKPPHLNNFLSVAFPIV